MMVDSGTRESVGDIGTVLSVRAEFTPDTSSASLDDNDWTEEYDQFASNDPLDETAGLEVCACVCACVCDNVWVVLSVVILYDSCREINYRMIIWFDIKIVEL